LVANIFGIDRVAGRDPIFGIESYRKMKIRLNLHVTSESDIRIAAAVIFLKQMLHKMRMAADGM
jgi:hypothetical protein